MRRVIAWLFGVAALAAPAQGLDVVELAPGVYAALSPAGHAGAANAGFVVLDDEVLIIDTYMVPSAARELRSLIRERTNAPVGFVVNTHWHPDHTQGGGVLASDPTDSPLFLAHALTRADIATLGRRRLERDRPHVEELADVELVLPNLTFARRLRLTAGGRDVLLLYFGRGHTRGDVVVYLPDERIAFVGDLITGGPPFARDGYPFAWVDTLRGLDELDAAILVGGHGRVWRGDGVVADRIRFLEHATETVRRGAAAGSSVPDIAASIDLERFRDTFDAEPESRPWRDWMTMLVERGLAELRASPRP